MRNLGSTHLRDINSTIFACCFLVQILLFRVSLGDAGFCRCLAAMLLVVHEVVRCAAATDAVIEICGVVIDDLEFDSR